jgi:uncharacterized membrane protein
MAIPLIVGMAGKLILGKVVQTAVAKAVEKVGNDKTVPEMKKADVAPVATAVIEELQKDQTFINATNSEAPIQSRVAWGSVIAALGVLVPLVGKVFGFEVSADRIMEIGGAVITLSGAGFALYGRFMPGLKPLFSKKGS